MKPIQLSEYLSTPAEKRAPGWVVVMRGAGAPSVVHASRGAAEAEANRLIGGLPCTVDQTALVMPIASVLTRKKDVRQPVVGGAFPIGVKDEDGSSTKPIRVHGIYEQRDGTIVGPIKDRGDDYSHARWTDGHLIWWTNGYYTSSDNPGPRDLVREVVVGEGWMPWNGGVVIASQPNEKVDIVTRSTNGYPTLCHFVSSLRWTHLGEPDDILAYRPRPDR